MFEVSPLDRFGALVAAEANLRARRQADFELLEIAAAWADLHPEESLPPAADELERRRRRLADEVEVRMGGDGTPLVLAHCPAELGLVLETTYTSAKHLIADALDLRHRLPRLWATVEAGKVAAWKARRVAAATRPLTAEQAAEVDATVHAVIATLGWTRFEAIMDATIKRTAPELAQAAEEAAATRRFVAVGRANDHHIMTLIARGTSLDILTFMATVKRIAEILEADGDIDPLDVRRSKAIGILARPAKALELLAAPQKDTDQSRSQTDPAAADNEEGGDDEDVRSEPADWGGEPDPEGDGQTSLQLGESPLHCSDPCRCAPRIQLHVHLTDAALVGRDPHAVCRVEGVGPVTAQTVRTWLGRDDISVTVRPVALPDQPAADSYEIPRRIRDALQLRNPASVFPWSNGTGRTLDLDHTIPYVPRGRDGPPGQTGLHNLGPLVRREHRHRTHGHVRVRQPSPGVFVWRSRHGWVWLVTNTGTHPLGNTPTAQAIWQAAAPRGRPQGKPKESASPEGYVLDLAHHQAGTVIEMT